MHEGKEAADIETTVTLGRMLILFESTFVNQLVRFLGNVRNQNRDFILAQSVGKNSCETVKGIFTRTTVRTSSGGAQAICLHH